MLNRFAVLIVGAVLAVGTTTPEPAAASSMERARRNYCLWCESWMGDDNVVYHTDYQWFGNPRIGTLHGVYPSACGVHNQYLQGGGGKPPVY